MLCEAQNDLPKLRLRAVYTCKTPDGYNDFSVFTSYYTSRKQVEIVCRWTADFELASNQVRLTIAFARR